jgi:hypothetical protein
MSSKYREYSSDKEPQSKIDFKKFFRGLVNSIFVLVSEILAGTLPLKWVPLNNNYLFIKK